MVVSVNGCVLLKHLFQKWQYFQYDWCSFLLWSLCNNSIITNFTPTADHQSNDALGIIFLRVCGHLFWNQPQSSHGNLAVCSYYQLCSQWVPVEQCIRVYSLSSRIRKDPVIISFFLCYLITLLPEHQLKLYIPFSNLLHEITFTEQFWRITGKYFILRRIKELTLHVTLVTGRIASLWCLGGSLRTSCSAASLNATSRH